MNPNHLPSQAWITLKMSRPTQKSLIQAGLGKPPKCLFGPISAQLLGRGWIPGQGCAAIQEAPQPRTCWARLAPSFLLNLPGADPRTRHFSQAASSAAWKHFQPLLPGQACPTSAGFTLTFLCSSWPWRLLPAPNLSGVSDAANAPLHPPVANPAQKLHFTPQTSAGARGHSRNHLILRHHEGTSTKPLISSSTAEAQPGNLHSLGQISPPGLWDRSERPRDVCFDPEVTSGVERSQQRHLQCLPSEPSSHQQAVLGSGAVMRRANIILHRCQELLLP